MRELLSCFMLGCFIIIACVICACDNQISTENNTSCVTEESESQDIIFQDEIYFDNRPLEEIPLEAYSINDFREYFGPYCSCAENDWAGYDISEPYDYINVIDTFPNGALRKYPVLAQNNQMMHIVYTVYKVQEGGYFYIMWAIKVLPEKKLVPDWYVSMLVYMQEQKNISDFEGLVIDESTAADVAEIDPSAEFVYGLGRGIASWHLLDDNSVLEIMYMPNEMHGETKSRKDLTIMSINVVSGELTGCWIYRINPDDLPKTAGTRGRFSCPVPS